MLTQERIEEFNISLLMKYGRYHDRQLYRLATTNNNFEFRWVEGREYFGPYFLREVKAKKEMPKYPRLEDRDKYVLEMLVDIPVTLKDELYGEDGHVTYEPLFIFKKVIDGNLKAIDPTWPMINILAFFSYALFTGRMEPETISPEFEMWKAEKEEYLRAYELLDDEIPDNLLHSIRRSGVFLGGKNGYLIQ
jgi:hypothetical protein